MTKEEVSSTTIEIMGKTYQIKCPETQQDSLQRAAEFLEEKMCITRDVAKVLSIDRIAVITALNIAHQYLSLEMETQIRTQNIQQRLSDLQDKLEYALAEQCQMELQ